MAFNLKLIGIGRGEGANDALNRRRYNKYQKHRKDTPYPLNCSLLHQIHLQFISLMTFFYFTPISNKQASSLKMAAATETDKMAALATAANEARGLAMDSIAAAHSGHMGLPLGCAEIGSILYGSQVSLILFNECGEICIGYDVFSYASF